MSDTETRCPTCSGDGSETWPLDNNCPSAWAHGHLKRRPAPPVVLPAETRCDCKGDGTGGHTDDCAVIQSLRQRFSARSAPSEPEGETPTLDAEWVAGLPRDEYGFTRTQEEWDRLAGYARGLASELTALRAVRQAAERLDTAAANVLLAFHDWPHYDSHTARSERHDSLNEMAERLAALRAALSPSGGEEKPE